MMILFWVILLVAVVVGIWYFSNLGKPRGWAPGEKETPLEKLKQRYAEGKISREEYEEAKKVLEEDKF